MTAPLSRPERGVRSARIINAALVTVTALAMVLVVILVIRTIDVERDQRAQAQQTSEVLAQLLDIRLAALNGDSGQRGFLLSLDRRYLAPYYTGRDRLEPSLRRLRAVIEPSANPRQLQLLDEIAVISRTKFAELAQGVALVQNGDLIEARRLVLTDEGQEAMERLKRALAELETIERTMLARARADADTAEARVLPLLLGLLGLLAISLVASARLIARGARAEAEAAQAQVLGEARDRADLLARELNHRVKNLFAVILAIVKLSARGAPEAKAVTDAIAHRIQALLRAHDVSQGELDTQEVALATLIETTLEPYRSPALTATVDGPPVTLNARSITPIGLMLHELTTNAVKYGAWSQPGGTIAVGWIHEGEDIVLTWCETGVTIAPRPPREGFGSLLITSSARQLGGTVERHIGADGVRIELRFPAPA